MRREIATKIGVKIPGERRLSLPVCPDFIEELARLNIKAGVSRQNLASSCRESHFSIGASGFLTFLHDEFY
jgi:hypothetical protein